MTFQMKVGKKVGKTVIIKDDPEEADEQVNDCGGWVE